MIKSTNPEIARLAETFATADLSETHLDTSPDASLLRRAQAGDPSVAVVHMGQGRTVEILPKEQKTIITYGLGGCQVCAVVSAKKDGGFVVTLTHYDPTALLENGTALKTLLAEHLRLAGPNADHHVLIASPGDWSQDLKTKKWALQPNDRRLVDFLDLSCRVVLGSGTLISSFGYSEVQKSGGSNSLILRTDSSNQTGLRYEICGSHYGVTGARKET